MNVIHKTGFVAAAFAVLLTCSAQDAQEPTSFGGPGGLSFAPQNNQKRTVQTENLIIAWPETNDELRGFSQPKGTWSTIDIEPVEKIVPIAGSSVAAVVFGKSVAAFSAEKGLWDVLHLSDSWTGASGGREQPVVDSELVRVTDGEHLYTFAASSGRWTSPTDKEYQSVTEVYTLRNPSNREIPLALQDWVTSLSQSELHGGLMFSGRNVTINADRRSWLEKVKAKLKELDVPPTNAAASNPFSGSSAPAGDPFVSRRDPFARSSTPAAESEQASIRLADQIRGRNSVTDADRQKLSQLVEKAFDERHQIQLAEVKRMEEKLQTIRQNLEQRQQNRDRIVERRVEELLDPSGNATAWDAEPVTTQSRSAANPLTGVPIGIAQPAQLPVPSASRGTAQDVSGRERTTGRIPWKDPGDIVAELRVLRSAAQTSVRTIAQSQPQLDLYSKPFDPNADYVPKGMPQDGWESARSAWESRVSQYSSALAQQLADWRRKWAIYETQLQILRSDVEFAAQKMEVAKKDVERLQKLHEKGVVPESEMRQTELLLANAKLVFEQAQHVLKLYESIAEEEPQLDPASFEDSTTEPDAEAKDPAATN